MFVFKKKEIIFHFVMFKYLPTIVVTPFLKCSSIILEKKRVIRVTDLFKSFAKSEYLEYLNLLVTSLIKIKNNKGA